MSLDVPGSPHTYWGHGTNLEYPCHLECQGLLLGYSS
ncbi:unnamed protein product [Brassica oleracea]